MSLVSRMGAVLPGITQVPGLVNVRNHYAPAADGRRFLVNTLAGETGNDPITVVLNWTANLPR